MFRHHFLAFLSTFAAFVLLTLITFSVPFVSSFFFLDGAGVRFGIWGWCSDDGTECSGPKTIGYAFEPEIVEWMTKVLVLYPISAGICLLTLFSHVPHLCSHRRDRVYPHPVSSFFAFMAFLTSFVAFVFMIALFTVAMSRFHDAGFSAHFGPLPWMSLAATVVLAVVTASSGCGNMCRRASPRLAYNL